MLAGKGLAAAAVAAELLAIEDVFSTYLYTGNGSTQTITNDIDLAGEGGLVWIKNRDQADSHILTDTERGATETLVSNTTAAEAADADTLTAFNADGFDLDADVKVNTSTEKYASWTFCKAPRFFDVVTYTGTGSARTVSHNLGLVPGCIMVKRTDSTGDWIVYHRSNTANPETDYLELNDTAATADDNTMWNDTAPTATEFTVGTDADVNASAATYVAYLFAHDPLGPSGDGSDGLIACGSYTGNGSSNGPEITLGWEPQWILVKRTDSGDNWFLVDIMRGITTGGADPWLLPNTSGAESTNTDDYIDVTATGFKLKRSTGEFNANGGTYIYIAIRRGPMREPTSGTEVFSPVFGDDTPPAFETGFPVDLGIYKSRLNAFGHGWNDRLRGQKILQSNTANAESGNTLAQFDYMDGWGDSVAFTDEYIGWNFRRAPGFFDVVAYTGTGSAQNISHNLGVVPELMIVKNRSDATGRAWAVYANNDNTDYLVLNTTAATADDNTYWNDTSPTASVFTVGSANSTNESGDTFIAYLFASLPGISKVGSYTGNGSSQTINCGFTGGARFFLVKASSTTGDWHVFDTARGIVAGNDPYLELNTTNAEDTDEDAVDTDSTGIIVNETSASNINTSGVTYIYLAIA
jgi:hypothetical protein